MQPVITAFHLKIHMAFCNAVDATGDGVSFCGHYQIVVLGETTSCNKCKGKRYGEVQDPYIHDCGALISCQSLLYRPLRQVLC